jgi:hypothetical protein
MGEGFQKNSQQQLNLAMKKKSGVQWKDSRWLAMLFLECLTQENTAESLQRQDRQEPTSSQNDRAE